MKRTSIISHQNTRILKKDNVLTFCVSYSLLVGRREIRKCIICLTRVPIHIQWILIPGPVEHVHQVFLVHFDELFDSFFMHVAELRIWFFNWIFNNCFVIFIILYHNNILRYGHVTREPIGLDWRCIVIDRWVFKSNWTFWARRRRGVYIIK